MSTPRYKFREANYSLMIMHMTNEGVTVKRISTFVRVNRTTVSGWKDGIYRPKDRSYSDMLVIFAMRFLTPEQMAECGVITGEMKMIQAAAALDEMARLDGRVGLP